MPKKMSFRPLKCDCGCDLTDKQASVVGMKGDVPMGYCPDCGIALPLGTPAEPEPEPTPD